MAAVFESKVCIVLMLVLILGDNFTFPVPKIVSTWSCTTTFAAALWSKVASHTTSNPHNFFACTARINQQLYNLVANTIANKADDKPTLQLLTIKSCVSALRKRRLAICVFREACTGVVYVNGLTKQNEGKK